MALAQKLSKNIISNSILMFSLRYVLLEDRLDETYFFQFDTFY